MTPIGTPRKARVEPCVWRSTWNDLERHRGLDFRPRAGFRHRSQLVRLAPSPAVGAHEDRIGSEPARGEGRKQAWTLVGQDDMPRFARFALAPLPPRHRR
jgi:hypothetical protein